MFTRFKNTISVSQDTLMVGGRLRYAPLSEFSKHPHLILLSHLTALQCEHDHIYSLHGGPKLVQCLIQRRYWIPGTCHLIRKRIFKCFSCYKLKAKLHQLYMADIPQFCFLQGRQMFYKCRIIFRRPIPCQKKHKKE